jgi:hypothetical protein
MKTIEAPTNPSEIDALTLLKDHCPNTDAHLELDHMVTVVFALPMQRSIKIGIAVVRCRRYSTIAIKVQMIRQEMR